MQSEQKCCLALKNALIMKGKKRTGMSHVQKQCVTLKNTLVIQAKKVIRHTTGIKTLPNIGKCIGNDPW